MNKEFWEKVYKDNRVTTEPSSFARFCTPLIRGSVVELGCGNGRDVHHFSRNGLSAYGVDAANEDIFIIKQDVAQFIKENTSPENVYTRFFWHAIEPSLQDEILSWVHGRIFIEARTIHDKPKNIVGKHKRYLVDNKKLVKKMEALGYNILSHEHGYGFSPFHGEDPHLFRIVADRS
jgi:SAM-dependent methyltransferase